MTSNPVRRLQVGDDVFDVTTEVDVPGQVHLAWLTGPNPGYGFSSRRSQGTHGDDELEAMARDFLANINPETGYLN